MPKPRSGAVRSASKQQHTAQTRKVLYRVGYNWNKGGRLKELRIRHLARKFLRIWIQNTFGRVLPHQAKSHYKGVVLKRVLEAWKNEWWTSRREWSLTVRAECHHRYFLYNQVFHRWKDFVILQNEKKLKIQNAQSFADRKHLHHALDVWEDFTEMRRIKKQNLDTAVQFYKQLTLKATWSKWRHKLQHIQNLYGMEDEFLKHKKLTIQQKVLLCWRDMYTVSCHKRLNEAKASRHNSTRLKRKAFNQWVMYVSFRCMKHKSKVVSQNTNKHSLMRLYWTKWCQALYEKWSNEVRLEAAGHLATRICQRRVLHHWEAYLKLCREKNGNIQKAQEHYHHHLLRAAFGGLAHNVQLNKSKRINNNVAIQHNQQATLGKFWRLWQERLEEAEERSYHSITEKAQITYSISLSRACFSIWREKLAELRHMRTLEKQADMLFADHIVPRCFQSWFHFTVKKNVHKQKKVEAETHNRQRQLSWAFHTWLGLSEKHKEQKLAEQMAIFHEEEKQMQKVWIFWRKQTEMKIKEREKQDLSEHLFQQRLMQKTIAQWMDNIAVIKERRNRELQACHQGVLCILRWAVRKWKKFVQMQKASRQRVEEMQQYREVQLLKHSMATWKKHNLQMHSVYTQVHALHQQQTQKSLRRTLGLWQENATESSQFRIKKQMARNHHRRVFQLKVFSAWREATVHAMTKHYQQMAVLSVAQESINKRELLQYFRKWRGKTVNVQTERLHMCKAERHRNTTVLSKAIRAWGNHHNQNQKYKVMKRQAGLLLRLKIWQSYFGLWKVKLQHKRREARQTEHALWHWSLSLQAKVLFAWRHYVIEQRRQREEVAQAAQFYRDKLLQKGVSCILTYAAQMNDLTTSLTQLTLQQRTRHIHRVVRRCALKWKHKALCKKDNNLEVQQTKKTVSFFLPEIRDNSQEEEDQALMKMLLTRMPRRQPRCSEELLQSPPRLAFLESVDLDTSVTSPGIAPQSQVLSSAAAPAVIFTNLDKNAVAELHSLPSEEPIQNPVLLMPPSAFMMTISQSAEDYSLEQSSCSTHQVIDPVADLTNELLGIKEDMKSYQEDKKQLRAWCKLQNVLQTWLQTSGKEHLMEKEAVCQELEELERSIAQLTSKLSMQKPTILQHVERIQHLQVTLQASLSTSPEIQI